MWIQTKREVASQEEKERKGTRGRTSSERESQGIEDPGDTLPEVEQDSVTSDEEDPEGPRRSRRIRGKPPKNFEASRDQEQPDNEESITFMTIADDFELESHSVAYAASKDPDTMYYHEAMREPDRDKFKEAMVKEVQAHTDNGVWILVRRAEVPVGTKIMPAVWAMKRKRKISTRVVYKWKARLNIDGSKQEEGVNFWETFAPVASWSTIRMILILSLLNEWHTKQIDFVLAYTQADVECDMYMAIPKGFEVDAEEEYVLKLKKNLFGQRQAGRVWNQHLVERLLRVGFTASKIDESLFFKGRNVFVLYTDDSILAGPDEAELEKIIQQMKEAELDLTVEGDIADFLGVQIERSEDGKSYNMTQPHLISAILQELRLDPGRTAIKRTTGSSSRPLLRNLKSEPFDGHFDYRRVIGQLNYLEKCTRMDISCATHQGARFVADPKVEHGKALKWLGRYLAGTRDKGIILNPDQNQGFEVYVDASFAGDWDPENAAWDDKTAKSRMGYIFMFAGCPILWASKVQGEVALSTTESEYIAISAATREVLPLIELMEELHEQGIIEQDIKPTMRCRVFEDNSGAIELATSVKSPKLRPRTKHINTKYHHFRQQVQEGRIVVQAIRTEDMLADILTKVVNEETLLRLRPRIMGW